MSWRRPHYAWALLSHDCPKQMFVLKTGVAKSVLNSRRRQNMFQYLRLVGPVGLYGLLALTLLRPLPALAASAAEIDREVDTAVQTLYNNVPVVPTLVAQARGILIFPKIVKGGFLVGGEYGEGALRLGGQTVGYYNIAAASYGLQAGLQEFGYALVFMTDAALQHLDRSEEHSTRIAINR